MDWLTTQIPPTSKFQIYTFNETASVLTEGTRGTWLEAGDVDALNTSVDRMRKVIPQKGTSLLNAFKAIGNMKPAPDNIFMLVDGLPTMGSEKPLRKRVSGSKRLKLFNEAIRKLPARIPVNIILYPMEGDPLAADCILAIWQKTPGDPFLLPLRIGRDLILDLGFRKCGLMILGIVEFDRRQTHGSSLNFSRESYREV